MAVEDRLEHLLLLWEDRYRAGQKVTPEDLCGDCPELCETLRQHIVTRLHIHFASSVETRPAALPDTVETGQAALPDTLDASPHRPEVVRLPIQKKWPEIPGYEILDELGRGGMGVVYKARQIRPDRFVALKMILSGGLASHSDLERFRREASVIARLNHPHLVQIYEVGEFEAVPFFSLELMEGGSLATRASGLPQPAIETARLVETLARAIHRVHEAGVIHRDLKPANILLTMDGTPKVADFGLAKRIGEAGPTLTGNILGTPSYMAPEQASGRVEHIGPHTDVYALGAILYELLTGRPPFLGVDAWLTIRQVTDAEAVPPRRFQPAVPIDLDTICQKCLEKEPRKRYGSGRELADDLSRFLAGEPIRARPISLWERAVKWARRKPTAAGLLAVSALAVVLLVAGAAVYVIHQRQALAETRKLAEQSRRRLVQLNVNEGTYAIDRGDWFGSLVWFAEALRLEEGDAKRERMHRVRLAAVLRQCPRQVLIGFHDSRVRQVTFSSDGRRMLSASEDGTAKLWDIDTGQSILTLRQSTAMLGAALSSDGQSVATAGADGAARLWDAATGQLTAELPHAGPVISVSFDSAGRRLLTASEDGTACVWTVATGKGPLSTMRHARPVRSAAFSADGTKVVTASADHTAAVWDTATARPLTPPLRHPETVNCAAFDPEGRRIVTAGADGLARIWDAATGQPSSIVLKHRLTIARASFTSDGRGVLTASNDHTASLWDAATGQLMTPSFQMESGVNVVAIDPRGAWIITGGDDNTACLWDARTGRWLPPLLQHQGAVLDVGFVLDEKRVVTGGNGGTARVWDVSRQLEPVRLGVRSSNRAALAARWSSPDGSRHATLEHDHAIQVRHANTGELLGPALPQRNRVFHAAFNTDGRLLLTASDANVARIWEVASGDLLAPLLRHKGVVTFAQFSPDDKLILTADDEQLARVWDARTGEPLTPPLRFTGAVRAATFARNNTAVDLTGDDGTSWLWDLRPDDRPVEDFRDLAQAMSGNRIDPARGLLPLGLETWRKTWHLVRSRHPEDFGPLPKNPE